MSGSVLEYSSLLSSCPHSVAICLGTEIEFQTDLYSIPANLTKPYLFTMTPLGLHTENKLQLETESRNQPLSGVLYLGTTIVLCS